MIDPYGSQSTGTMRFRSYCWSMVLQPVSCARNKDLRVEHAPGVGHGNARIDVVVQRRAILEHLAERHSRRVREQLQRASAFARGERERTDQESEKVAKCVRCACMGCPTPLRCPGRAHALVEVQPVGVDSIGSARVRHELCVPMVRKTEMGGRAG